MRTNYLLRKSFSILLAFCLLATVLPAAMPVAQAEEETYTLTMTDISGDFEYHNYPGLYVGRSAIYRIRLFRDSDGAEIPTDTAGVISQTQSKIGVVYTNANTNGGYYHLILAGIKEDSVDYTITADVDGDGVADAELVRRLNVTHQPLTVRSLHYDFLKMCEFYVPGRTWSSYTTKGYKTEQITSLDMTTAGHTNEIYPDSYIKTHPWCFVSSNLDTPATLSPQFKYASQNGFGGHSSDMYIRFKVYVPRAGTYTPVTKHSANKYSPKVDIYLAPVHAIDPEAAEYHLGTVDTSHPVGVGDPETDASDNFNYGNDASSDYVLEPVTLTEPGEYYLTYRWNGKGIFGQHSGRFRTAGFILKAPTLAFKTVDVTVDDAEIEAGSKTQARIAATLDDDSAATETDLSLASISYTSSAPLIAAVDEQTGEITGVAEGEAVITVEIEGEDGNKVSDTVTVSVTGPALSSIAITTPPTKTTYTVGEELDLSGLVVTGTYSDSSTEVLSVTAENITGFDSSTDAPSQTLTVTVDGKTATFDVKIVRVLDSISATGRITIDGYADEPAWEINKTLTRSKSGGDNTATFGTLWDEDNLYVFVDVVDDVLVNNSNKHYYDDCVEIYIDGDMVKGEYNSHCAQYTFRYGDATKYVHPVSTASTDGVEHISRATETGYAVELKIPWSSIGGLTVEEGKTIGFTVHVNDKDTTDNPAGKEEDIIFYTVDSPNEDYQDSTNWAEMTLTAWQNPVEETESTGTVNIDAGGAPAGAITATVNGIPVDISNPGDLTLGDVVEMNADPEPDAGKKFLFWMDPVSKRLVSNQQQVTFTVGTNTQITAVYKDAGQGHIVIFFDKNGKVLSNEYLADGASITAPENPYSVGYSFTGWSPTVPSVAKNDYAFIAQYEEEDGTYTVTVENGSISPESETYKYNTKVTVTAASPEEGRKFAYWTKNGVIVSYASTYSFYVWDDTEICAVSVPEAETVSPAPAIYMDDNVKNDGESGRLIFASERTLPAGYTLIETGILISELNSNPDLDNCDEKAVAQSESGSGQFTARVDGLDSDDSRYARAYMIYKTPEGEYKVIYSNAVIGTV